VQRGKYTSTLHHNSISRGSSETLLARIETAASSGVLTEVTSALPLVPTDDGGQRELLDETAKKMLADCIHELRVSAGVFRDGVDTGAPASSPNRENAS
jgi:hypothetical protein